MAFFVQLAVQVVHQGLHLFWGLRLCCDFVLLDFINQNSELGRHKLRLQKREVEQKFFLLVSQFFALRCLLTILGALSVFVSEIV